MQLDRITNAFINFDQLNIIMQKLEGKIALITGGNSGIGLATAKQFVAEGAYVYITGRRQSELDESVKQIGKNVSGIRGDVSNLEDLDSLYTTLKEQKGRLDVLFANAGMREFSPLQTISEEHFDKTFGVNVKGVLFTVQKSLPLFQDGGSIILNSSIATSKPTEGYSVYAATKAAVRSFARTWTIELRQRKIRVNAISPGPVDTPGLNKSFDGLGLTAEEIKNKLADAVPLGRMGSPNEIAKAVLFLASDDSSYVTGIELFVDSGIAQI
jgi:NAD(P)-dependent dehydrogenase (short-subunit alcohol dehydrogenase family)